MNHLRLSSRPERLPAAALLLFGWLLLPGLLVAEDAIPIFVSGQDRAYEPLSPTEPKVITVRGPGELRLVSRVRFQPRMGENVRYSLRIRVDGGVEQEVVYENVERSRTAMFRDGTLGVPGRLMDYRLQLRRGYHNISIVPGPDEPQIFYRTLFKPTRERRRAWVSLEPLALEPLAAPELVELEVREAIVPYYRGSANEPFQVEVIGPTELRIFTRVENTAEMRGRIHYRLQLREGERVVNTFQLSSRRSDIASYRSFDSLVPGRAAEVVIPIPEGMHRLEVVPMDLDKSILARFMLPREDLSLTVE